MKKLIFILALFSFMAYSQTILNPNPLSLTYKSRFSGQDTTGALSYHYFPQSKFTIGWQWGHHPRLSYELSSGMFQNTYHDGQNTILDATPNYTPPEKIDAVVGIANCFPVSAQSIQYEPTLWIPEALRGTFITRENDPSDPIFGFANIRGRRPENSSDPNYSRLILDSAALVNNVVLSYPWPSPHLPPTSGLSVRRIEFGDILFETFFIFLFHYNNELCKFEERLLDGEKRGSWEQEKRNKTTA